MVNQGDTEKAELFRREALKYWQLIKKVSPTILSVYEHIRVLDSPDRDVADLVEIADLVRWFKKSNKQVIFDADHLDIVKLIKIGQEFENAHVVEEGLDEFIENLNVLKNVDDDYFSGLYASNAYVAVNKKYLP